MAVLENVVVAVEVAVMVGEGVAVGTVVAVGAEEGLAINLPISMIGDRWGPVQGVDRQPPCPNGVVAAVQPGPVCHETKVGALNVYETNAVCNTQRTLSQAYAPRSPGVLVAPQKERRSCLSYGPGTQQGNGWRIAIYFPTELSPQSVNTKLGGNFPGRPRFFQHDKSDGIGPNLTFFWGGGEGIEKCNGFEGQNGAVAHCHAALRHPNAPGRRWPCRWQWRWRSACRCRSGWCWR